MPIRYTAATSTSSPALRLAVVGAGAFGRNHLRVLSALAVESAAVKLVAVVDPSEASRSGAASDFGIAAFASTDELLSSGLAIDAASICTPTVHHAATAIALMAAGIDVLIEKPIAATLAEADSIVAAAQVHSRIVQVGHLERFNPAVTAAFPLLNRPMFFESHRLSVFTPRSLDVDVVLDLMIHDLDIVLRLANSPVREVRAVGLPVLSRKTDIANVRVEFQSGAVANFTASRISTERVRKLRFFQPHQYLSLDFARQDLLMIDVTAGSLLASAEASISAEHITAAAQTSPALQSSAPHVPAIAPISPAQLSALLTASGQSSDQAPQHPTEGLSLRKIPTTSGEPLRLEMEDFLRAVRSRTPPGVTAEQARAALALALQINEAIRTHAERAGLSQDSPAFP